MNPEKAREYFSAYYEGTLEKGLSETFERALRTDAQVQAEFRSFERLMKELEVLKEPAPQPDEDLHELISRRLDKHIFEQKRRVSIPLLGWWKGVALGGLAAAALFATIWQLQPNTGGTGTAIAGITANSASLDKVELRKIKDVYGVEYRTKGEKAIVIRAGDGSILTQKLISDGTFTAPLSNENDTAALLQVEVLGESAITYVALPGKKRLPSPNGEGGIKDLAVALAGFYQVPVVLNVQEDVTLKWQFGATEPIEAAEKSLASTTYSALKRPDGVLSIQPN